MMRKKDSEMEHNKIIELKEQDKKERYKLDSMKP